MAVKCGMPALHSEYGHLRFRFDLLPHGQAALAETRWTGAAAQGGGQEAAPMEEDAPATARPPRGGANAHRAAAQDGGQALAPAADEDSAGAMDDDDDDELGRLRRKAAVRREAKKRQKANRRERDRAARAGSAAAAAAATPAVVTPAAFTFGGGTRPGLDPAAPTFVFGTSGSGSPPTPGDSGETAGGGGAPARQRESRIACPALMAGPGDMPMVRAQTMLLEKITAANCARARSSSDDELWRGGGVGTTSHSCVFPGQDATIGRRQVVLLAGSRGARMSETELGAALALQLNPQLDDVRLRQLIVQLGKQADVGA